MIKIKYSLTPNFKLEVKGHAKYDDYGKDIVCSAVSAVIVGGINAFEDNEKMKITVKEGLIRVISETTLSEKDEIVFYTMITQMNSIIEEYKEFVKIIK